MRHSICAVARRAPAIRRSPHEKRSIDSLLRQADVGRQPATVDIVRIARLGNWGIAVGSRGPSRLVVLLCKRQLAKLREELVEPI
jgi:hypothetical protein